MAREYPRLGRSGKANGWLKNPKGAPACDVIGCTAKATHRVDIEVNWFRGDDECCRACAAHKLSMPELLTGAAARQAANEAANEARRRAQNTTQKGPSA